MTILIDLNDVPLVEADDLTRVMQRLIAKEEGLILLKGRTAETHRALEDAIWTVFEDQPEARLAVLLRFEALLHLFQQRRLRTLFTMHGLAILTSVFEVAATQRLNMTWGFNAQAFLGTLKTLQQRADETPEQPYSPQTLVPVTAGNSEQLAA